MSKLELLERLTEKLKRRRENRKVLLEAGDSRENLRHWTRRNRIARGLPPDSDPPPPTE